MKNETPIYAIDFEGSKSLGIVEFGIAEILRGKVSKVYTAICAPQRAISPKDAKFFGISNEFAKTFAPFEAHCELFCDLRSRGIFAAHNHSTEDTLLRSHIPSPGRVKNFFTAMDTLAWAPWLDSRDFAKFLKPDLKSEKLSECIRELNLQDRLKKSAERFCESSRADWHRALFDALASAEIISAALEKLSDFSELKEFAPGANQGEIFL